MSDTDSMRMIVSLDISQSIESPLDIPAVEFMTRHKNNIYWFSTIIPHNIGTYLEFQFDDFRLTCSIGKYTISFDIPNKPHIEPAIYHMVSAYDETSNNMKQQSKKGSLIKKSKSLQKSTSTINTKPMGKTSRKIKMEVVSKTSEEPSSKRRRKLASDVQEATSTLPVIGKKLAKGRGKAIPPAIEQSSAEFARDDIQKSTEDGQLTMPRDQQPSINMPLKGRKKHTASMSDENERVSTSQEAGDVVAPSIDAEMATDNQPTTAPTIQLPLKRGRKKREESINDDGVKSLPAPEDSKPLECVNADEADNVEIQKVPESLAQAGTSVTEESSLPISQPLKPSRYPMAVPVAPFETKVTLSRPVTPISLQGDFFSVTFSTRLSGYIYDDFFNSTDNILYDQTVPVSIFLEQNKTTYGNKLESLFNKYFESHLITSQEKASRSFKVKSSKMKAKNYSECFPLIYFVRFLICMTKIDVVDPKTKFDKAEIRKFQESLSTLCEAIEKRVHYHESKLA